MAAKLINPPRKARALSGPGRLPLTKNLINKTPEELQRTLTRFGIQPDLVAMEKRALKAFDQLEELITRGQEPDAATWKTIEKRIEKEVTGQLREMTKAAIRNYRNERVRNISDKLTWITVGDEAVCDSCEPRHGKTKSFKQWERQGLPGDRVLVCCSDEKRCRCMLQPDIHPEAEITP